jgi:Leucine-rich repeat (LRR) protein
LLLSCGVLFGVILYYVLSRNIFLESHGILLETFTSDILLSVLNSRINSLSTLPAEIGDLSRLGTLDLRSNQLKEYPVGACKLKLSYLDLSNNSLTGLHPELGNMTTLRKLVLVGNPLRTLRSSLVNGPTAALLKYLRSRLSNSEETSASTPTKENVIASAARMSISSKVSEPQI